MTTRRLRTLVIAPAVPTPHGAGRDARVFQLIRQSASKNDVDVLCYDSDDDPGDVRGVAREVVLIEPPRPLARSKRAGQIASLARRRSHSLSLQRSRRMQAAVRERISSGGYDIVQVELAHLAWLDLTGASRTILDAHNIETEVIARLASTDRSALRRAYYRAEARHMRDEEQAQWSAFDGCAVPSQREADTVAAVAPDCRVAVVSNGVDLEYFRPLAVPDHAMRLVFTGTMNYRPNADAAIQLVREILPRVREHLPEATVQICGMSPPRDVQALAGPAVEVTGRVDDMRPCIAGAGVVVVPLRSGGGTRLKVLEALAMGRPLVSTTVGCEGLNLEAGRHFLRADTADDFAMAAVRVLTDHSLAHRLGVAGRERVSALYSWEASGEALEQLYRSVLGLARAA